MGTHIHGFFAREAASSPPALRAMLEDLTVERSEEIRILRDRGWFSRGGGDWLVDWDRPGGGEPESIFGEGPAGLGIDVYRRVVLVSSSERFCALHDEEIGVALPLRRLLCSMALRLGTSPRIAFAAGGMGDTDRAADLAYYEGGSFDAVCACLAEELGSPARIWGELGYEGRPWYLGTPEPC